MQSQGHLEVSRVGIGLEDLRLHAEGAREQVLHVLVTLLPVRQQQLRQLDPLANKHINTRENILGPSVYLPPVDLPGASWRTAPHLDVVVLGTEGEQRLPTLIADLNIDHPFGIAISSRASSCCA